jgi:hypothetical protein
MPGVLLGTEGATARFNKEPLNGYDAETIDLGGCANTLAASLLCGEGHQPYNSVIVKVEPWTGIQLKPQYRWAGDVPKLSEVE